MAAWFSPSGTVSRSGKMHRGKRFGEIPKRFRENTFRQIVSAQFGEMLMWGKINQRRQALLQSAPDLLYKEALSEPYNSAKSPGKPLVTGAFCPDGVKNVPTRIVSKTGRDGGGSGGIRTHVPSRTTAFRVRLVTTTSIRFHVPLRGTGRPGNGSPCSFGGATRI